VYGWADLTRSMVAWGVAIGGFAAYKFGLFHSMLGLSPAPAASSSKGGFSMEEMEAWNDKLRKDPHVRAAKKDKEAAAITAAAKAAQGDEPARQ
jgi:hypothetical protein